jgi:hypothetical protein
MGQSVFTGSAGNGSLKIASRGLSSFWGFHVNLTESDEHTARIQGALFELLRKTLGYDRN